MRQIERGVYKPAADVLKSIAQALDISAETLYTQAGLLDQDAEAPEGRVEEAFRLDPRLNEEQKAMLINVYRQFVNR